MAIPEKADGNQSWGNDYRAIVRRINALTNDATSKVPPAQLGLGTPTASTFLRGDGQYATPPTWSPWVDQAWAASLTINASAGTRRKILATGDFTLQEPASGADGQPLWIRVTPSGAQRVVTLASALRRPSFIPSTLTVPLGQRGDIAMVFESSFGWTVLAAAAA